MKITDEAIAAARAEMRPFVPPNDETLRRAITAALAEQTQQGVEVKPADHIGAIVPSHCSGYSFVFDPGTIHVRKDGSGYIVVNEDDFFLEDDRCEGPDGPEGSVHWIARMGVSEINALRNFLNGAPTPQEEVMVAAEKAWSTIDLATASRKMIINCIAQAIMNDRARNSLRNAAITFRCPEGFEALSTALDMDLTEKDRSRLDDALKAIIQGGAEL